MFCRTCGKEIPDYSKVCMYCGTAIEGDSEPSEKSEPYQNDDFASNTSNDGAFAFGQSETPGNIVAGLVKTLKSNPKYLAVAAAGVLLVVIILVIIIASVAGSSGGSYIFKQKNFYTVSTSTSEYIFCNGNEIFECDGGYDRFTVSSDGSACALICDGELYYSKGEAIKKPIADDVYTVSISESGNGLIYKTSDEIGFYNGGKPQTVYDDDLQVADAVISPDGQTVAYSTKEYVDGEEEYNAYVFRNGKSEEVGKYGVLSVANNAEVLYLYKSSTKSNKLYKALNMGEPESICSIELCMTYAETNMNGSAYYFNSTAAYMVSTFDHRTILFTADSENYDTNYCAPSSKEKINVSDDMIFPLAPDSADGISSFDNFIGYSGSEVFRYYKDGDEFKADKIVKVGSSSEFLLSKDAKTLVMLNGDKLYRIDTNNKDAEKIKLLDDVISFVMGDDLSSIYSVNDEEQLVYYDGSENGRRIADEPSNVCITQDGTCIFTIDDTLYYSVRGGEKQKVSACGEVAKISVNGNYVVVYNEDGEIFLSNDGRSYNKSKIED